MSIKYKEQTISGPPGVTFTPSVSYEGVLSWTNDGELENPEPVDIKGPAGETGPEGPTGETGPAGQNATINGENAINLVAGDNVEIEQQDGTLTISATGGGSSAGEVYSTEETRIGTWIDGKPLYRKTAVFKCTGDNTQFPAFEYKELVNGYGFGVSNNSRSLIPNSSASIYINGENVIIYLAKATVGSDLTITLEYTKTTD